MSNMVPEPVFPRTLYAVALLVVGFGAEAERICGKQGISPRGKNCRLSVRSLQQTDTAASPRLVHDGTELARALADEDVQQVWIAVSELDLAESDWSSLAGATPLLLARNVTITGSPTLTKYPTINFNYVRNKVRLAAGASLTFSHVVMEAFRSDNPTQSPGMDLLARAGGISELIIFRTVLVLPACFPGNIRLANHEGFARPPGYPPGVQVHRSANQTACDDSPTAPAERRCWVDREIEEDVVMYGADTDAATGRLVPNDMYVLLQNATMACERLLDVDCISKLTPLGCYLAVVRNVTGNPGSGAQASGSSITVSVVAGAVCGAVAGAALISIMILLAVALVRRRRRKALTATSSDKEKPQDTTSPSRDWRGRELRPATPKPQATSGGQNTNSEERQQQAEAPSAAASKPVVNGSSGPHWLATSDMPVTLLTPHREDLQMGVRLTMGPTASGTNTRCGGVTSGGVGGGAGGCGPDGLWCANGGSTTTDVRQGESPSSGMVTLLPVTRGKGSCGRVMEGMYDGQKVAVKLLEHGWRLELGQQQQEGQEQGQQEQEPQHGGALTMRDPLVASFAREVEVLGRCSHPNVVRLLAACVTPPRLCLVMELMETSLEGLLYGTYSLGGMFMPLPKVLHIAASICRALAYLHPTISHRDLKPANVLINNPLSDTPVVKLGDFGLSTLRVTQAPTLHPDAGTPAYMGPECFDTQNDVITHKADMYSLGVLLWEMLAGVPPWMGLNGVEVALKVAYMHERPPLSAPLPHRCTPRLCALLDSCWQRDPDRRPAAAEVANELATIMEMLRYQAAARTPAVRTSFHL